MQIAVRDKYGLLSYGLQVLNVYQQSWVRRGPDRRESASFVYSRSEAHLEGVIIELASELVVVLGNGFTCGSSALSEHRWQVGLRSIHLLLAASLSKIAFEPLRSDDGLGVDALFVDHIVRRSEVSLLKCVLRRAVALQQMVGEAALLEVHRAIVVLELLLFLFSQETVN